MRLTKAFTTWLFLALLAGTWSLGGGIDAASELFPADIYPAERTAVRRLTELAADALNSEPKVAGEPATFVVVTRGPLTPEMAGVCVDTLRSCFPQSTVRRQEAGVDPGAGAILVELSESESTGPSTGSDLPPGGRISLRIERNSGPSLNVSARFFEKPWADDWAAFKNANPKVRHLLAESRQLYPSEAEALASARADAVEQLVPIIKQAMNASAARSSGEKIIVTDEWVRERVKSSIERNTYSLLIPDQFIQRYSRPYGDVWRVQLLVDASTKNVGDLVKAYNVVANAQFGTKARGFGALGGTILILVLVYAFVNSFTRGYFVWRLRAVALLLAIVAALVVFAVT